MIEIKNLVIEYKDIIAVNNVTLQLKDGCIHGIAGPNGAGKSSLMQAMVGIISEYEGTIKYDDLLLSLNRYEIKKRTGYAPENVELIYHLTGRELLYMIAEIRQIKNGYNHIENLLDIFSLQRKKDNLISTYSHGMMQKLSIACALVGEPQYLILDEALNGIDPVSLFRLKGYLADLAKKGHCILISSHILELIEKWCDQIIIMNNGKILSLFSQNELKRICREQDKEFDEIFVELVQKSER